MNELVIIGGVVMSPAGPRTVTVVVNGGAVDALLEPHEQPHAEQRIDAHGLVVLPGVVDTHTHFRDPSVEAREDSTSGTIAAAAGGVTTVIEMPISSPGVSNPSVLAQRSKRWAERAVVDFSFYGGAGQENLEDIGDLAEAGVVGFKTFLHPPARGREEEFRGLWCHDNGALAEVMQAVARTGLIHAIHCEDVAIISALRSKPALDKGNPLNHARVQPLVCEDASVANVLAIGARVSARVHPVHISSPSAAALIRAARQRGESVSAEVSPNHLFLDESELVRCGPFAKCNPPLRNNASQQLLWNYVLDGTIDVIGSDHAPFTVEEKQEGCGDIFAAPPGIPAIEVMLPLLLSAVQENRLSWERLVSLTSSRAARLFGLTKKGAIAPGYDGDFAVVDPRARWRFDRTLARSRSGRGLLSYDGRPMVGKLVTTVVRGKVVYADGSLEARPGWGQLVHRTPVPASARKTLVDEQRKDAPAWTSD